LCPTVQQLDDRIPVGGQRLMTRAHRLQFGSFPGWSASGATRPTAGTG